MAPGVVPSLLHLGSTGTLFRENVLFLDRPPLRAPILSLEIGPQLHPERSRPGGMAMRRLALGERLFDRPPVAG